MERGCILAAARRLPLGEGLELRLLSAMEVLEARREAAQLAAEGREQALCSNACLLARALERRGRPAYDNGAAVLRDLTVEGIVTLARRWSDFNRAENPSLTAEEGEVDALKKVWSTRRRSAWRGVCSGPLGRSPRRTGSGR
jgi:hypothetical protein